MKKSIFIYILFLIIFHFNSLSAQICEGTYETTDGFCQLPNGVVSAVGDKVTIFVISATQIGILGICNSPTALVADYSNGGFTIPPQIIQEQFAPCAISGVGGFIGDDCQALSLTYSILDTETGVPQGGCDLTWAVYIGGGNNCSAPSNFEISEFSDNSATINWNPISNATAYYIQARELGTIDWTIAGEVMNAGAILNNLKSCTIYEYQVGTICGGTNSSFSAPQVFLTAGCEEDDCLAPTNLTANDITDNSATIVWNEVTTATAYFIQMRKVGTSNWAITGEVPSTGASANGILESCTEYEYQVRSICNDQTSNFSNIRTFTTTGCSSSEYCNANGEDTGDEWIQKVALAEINYTSGNNDGYADLTSKTTHLELGKNYSFTLTPGYSGNPFTEYWRIWIDYNRDGDFADSGEMVFDAGEEKTGVVSGQFSVRETAKLGTTRMRIAMKWVGVFEDNSSDLALPESCGTFSFGEVEDYTVQITNIVDIEDVKNGGADILLGQSYPNPSSNTITIPFYLPQSTSIQLSIYDVAGQEVMTILEEEAKQGYQEVKVDIHNLTNGVYYYLLQNEEGIWGKKMTIIH
ncbi:MAG: GEVED domain-containing protein [Chitinophagales bacterium]